MTRNPTNVLRLACLLLVDLYHVLVRVYGCACVVSQASVLVSQMLTHKMS